MRTTFSAYYKKNSNPVLWMFPDLQSISDKRRIGRMWVVFQGKRLKKCTISFGLVQLKKFRQVWKASLLMKVIFLFMMVS